MPRWSKFSLRELLLVVAVVALAMVLWLTARQVPPAAPAGVLPADGSQITVPGPLLVSYRVRTSPNSTSGSTGVQVEKLHLLEGGIVLQYKDGRSRWIDSSRIVELSWRPQP